MLSLGELAARLGLPIGDADPDVVVSGIGTLADAGPSQLAFVAERRYLDTLEGTSAACVLLRPEWAELSPVPVLCTDDPYLAYARASALFDEAPCPQPGIDPRAAVADDVSLGVGVSIGPGACVEAGASLGDGVIIGPGACVGAGVSIGAATRLYANVVVYHGVTLGERCTVHAGTVIGADGFGFARGPSGWEKVHQLGSVRVGSDVDIGASVTIDRGALGDTVIADGVIIDDQVHIAHNCHIGERTAIAGCVGFAGSTRVGSDCTFAGQVGVSGHLLICDNVHFTGQARVTRSIDEPGSYSSGTPLEPTRRWGRNAVRFSQLDSLAQRVRELEQALEQALGKTLGKAPADAPGTPAGESVDTTPTDNEDDAG